MINIDIFTSVKLITAVARHRGNASYDTLYAQPAVATARDNRKTTAVTRLTAHQWRFQAAGQAGHQQ